MFAKESIELLKQRVDLVDVVSAQLPLQRAGQAFKACCPFHEEKTPSFVIQRGESHYHCFGCGAHGDAIAFLMRYMKMSFVDSLEYLAERYGIVLEKSDMETQKKGPGKPAMKEALELACQFYHFSLLHTQEGHVPLHYLYERGITLDFICAFQIGYAPSGSTTLLKVLKERGLKEEVMQEAGLLFTSSSGKRRDFFCDRITFPIRDGYGAVIGFSARKFKEETYGGKYINTPETPLFKKAHVLYGLSYCRQQIAKERKVLVVEGQLDALRLIHLGFTWTVAGQGTAFGSGHIDQLIQLGVNHAYLALDGDNAGATATMKIGHLFQKRGIEVTVVKLPPGKDPDDILKEEGPESFAQRIEQGVDYLTFLFHHLAKDIDSNSPSQKNEIVTRIATEIRGWDHAVMVHESLRRLAEIACVPQEVVGVGLLATTRVQVRKTENAGSLQVDPDRIMEADVLRWLFFGSAHDPKLSGIVRLNLRREHFRLEASCALFDVYLASEGAPVDLFSLTMHTEDKEASKLLKEILSKKINVERACEGLEGAIYKMLEREWMEKREAIRQKMHSGLLSEEEMLNLAKEFDLLKKHPPQVQKIYTQNDSKVGV